MFLHSGGLSVSPEGIFPGQWRRQKIFPGGGNVDMSSEGVENNTEDVQKGNVLRGILSPSKVLGL